MLGMGKREKREGDIRYVSFFYDIINKTLKLQKFYS